MMMHNARVMISVILLACLSHLGRAQDAAPHTVESSDKQTGDEENDDIIKGYPVDKDTYIQVTKDELENIALESTRTIEIDEFVPKSDIDTRYLIRPYYLVPDGKIGHDAYAVIRETNRQMDKVALGRVVLTSRASSSLNRWVKV